MKFIVLARTSSIKFDAAAKGLLLKINAGIITPQIMKIQGEISAVKYKLVLKTLKYSKNLCSFFLSAAIHKKSFSNNLNLASHKTSEVTRD